MTADELSRDIHRRYTEYTQQGTDESAVRELARDIQKLVADEREACARLVEEDHNSCENCNYAGDHPDSRGRSLAEKIRARGSKP